MLDIRSRDDTLHTVPPFNSPQLCNSAGPPMSQNLFTDWLGLRGFRPPKAVICHLRALEAGEAITGSAGGGVSNRRQPDDSAVHSHKNTSARQLWCLTDCPSHRKHHIQQKKLSWILMKSAVQSVFHGNLVSLYFFTEHEERHAVYIPVVPKRQQESKCLAAKLSSWHGRTMDVFSLLCWRCSL